MKILYSKLFLKKYISVAIIFIALLFAASLSFAFSKQSPLFNKKAETTENKFNQNAATPTPTKEPNKQIILGAKISSALAKEQPAPTVLPTLKSATTPQSVNETNPTEQTMQTIPTPTLVVPNATSTPLPVNTVSVAIKTPDSSSNFSVVINDGMNVCDILQKAKDEGQVASLTLDDSYMSTLHSKYVYEINGYKNNWTFTVNGTSPSGCSLSNPKPNDSIVWNYL